MSHFYHEEVVFCGFWENSLEKLNIKGFFSKTQNSFLFSLVSSLLSLVYSLAWEETGMWPQGKVPVRQSESCWREAWNSEVGVAYVSVIKPCARRTLDFVERAVRKSCLSEHLDARRRIWPCRTHLKVWWGVTGWRWKQMGAVCWLKVDFIFQAVVG